MHPILARGGRLGPYVAAWLALGGLIAVLAHLAAGSPWFEALLLSVPLALVYAFICLASYYPCRAAPVSLVSFPRLLVTHLLAALFSAALWLFLAITWAVTLETLPPFAGVAERLGRLVVVLAVTALLLYTLAAAIHYVLIAFEEARQRELRQLELEMAAREAELRALRAQVDPHFLFNALHAIASLTTGQPQAARQMCLELADFFRSSLSLGARQQIPLAEELALVERYLAIEQVRFGERLRVARELDEAALGCAVPPLILQPLVENAVRHGIAGLVAGGEVRIGVQRRGERVAITVSNPVDSQAEPPGGEGLGLANVRARLLAGYGGEALLDVIPGPHEFRVTLEVPLVAFAATGPAGA